MHYGFMVDVLFSIRQDVVPDPVPNIIVLIVGNVNTVGNYLIRQPVLDFTTTYT